MGCCRSAPGGNPRTSCPSTYRRAYARKGTRRRAHRQHQFSLRPHQAQKLVHTSQDSLHHHVGSSGETRRDDCRSTENSDPRPGRGPQPRGDAGSGAGLLVGHRSLPGPEVPQGLGPQRLLPGAGHQGRQGPEDLQQPPPRHGHRGAVQRGRLRNAPGRGPGADEPGLERPLRRADREQLRRAGHRLRLPQSCPGQGRPAHPERPGHRSQRSQPAQQGLRPLLHRLPRWGRRQPDVVAQPLRRPRAARALALRDQGFRPRLVQHAGCQPHRQQLQVLHLPLAAGPGRVDVRRPRSRRGRHPGVPGAPVRLLRGQGLHEDVGRLLLGSRRARSATPRT